METDNKSWLRKQKKKIKRFEALMLQNRKNMSEVKKTHNTPAEEMTKRFCCLFKAPENNFKFKS